MKVVVASVVFVAQSCLAFILRLLCLRYKAHISRENSVEMGGAYPMSSRDDGLMWLNVSDSGIGSHVYHGNVGGEDGRERSRQHA